MKTLYLQSMRLSPTSSARHWITGFSIILAGLMAIGCNRSESDWGKAQIADDMPSYKRYLELHPDGTHVAEARKGLERLAWSAGLEKMDLSGFSEQYPESQYWDHARGALRTLLANGDILAVWRLAGTILTGRSGDPVAEYAFAIAGFAEGDAEGVSLVSSDLKSMREPQIVENWLSGLDPAAPPTVTAILARAEWGLHDLRSLEDAEDALRSARSAGLTSHAIDWCEKRLAAAREGRNPEQWNKIETTTRFSGQIGSPGRFTLSADGDIVSSLGDEQHMVSVVKASLLVRQGDQLVLVNPSGGRMEVPESGDLSELKMVWDDPILGHVIHLGPGTLFVTGDQYIATSRALAAVHEINQPPVTPMDAWGEFFEVVVPLGEDSSFALLIPQ